MSVRLRLATTWMNEEWYNDRIRTAADPNWVWSIYQWPGLIPNHMYTAPKLRVLAKPNCLHVPDRSGS